MNYPPPHLAQLPAAIAPVASVDLKGIPTAASFILPVGLGAAVGLVISNQQKNQSTLNHAMWTLGGGAISFVAAFLYWGLNNRGGTPSTGASNEPR
jgi:hypothetical protein